MNSLEQNLLVAKLLTQKGDFAEARELALQALHSALLLNQRPQWLEASRLVFQCCQELEEPQGAYEAIEEILHYLRSNPPEELQAPAETLVASWLLSQGKIAESQDYTHSAINKATHRRDLPTLTRALLVLAFTQTLDPATYAQALLTLDKLDILLGEIENPETQLSSYNLRGFIYTQKMQFKEAMDILWQSYEQAKLHGFYPLISSILAQMARVYRDQKYDEQYKIYAELALKGTDQNKMPRLYHLVSAICPHGLESLRPEYDFKIDENERWVEEKTKGVIDFKNQHILYDMALLFIKNPGKRFSKDDLVAHIWKQVYDPDLHDNLIYVSIKRLRTLIEPDAESPRYILRDRKGYYFNPQTVIYFKHNLEEANI